MNTKYRGFFTES